MSTPLSTHLMHATLALFEAERQKALATISLYLNAPVGVGEHPDVVDNIAAAARQLAEAEEALETLNRNFLNSTEAPSDD